MYLGSLITAMVTPFKEDLSVDYNTAKKLAKFLVDNGSDGIVVCGTTGESPTLTHDEKLKLFKTVKEVVGDNASVIAGTGSNSTAASIELTKQTEKTSVDAILAVAPYYNKPPQEGLYRHFKAIADNTKLPVIIYNIPSRSVVNISADTTIALSEVNNIVGTKEASGNYDDIAKIINKTSDGFLVFSGDDSATYPIMSLGGDGVISVTSHVAGNQMREMLDYCHKGVWDRALTLHNRLLPLFKGMFVTTSPILIKAALAEIGMPVGSLRLPLINASNEQISALKKVMVETGIITSVASIT
ncbi:MAG: 4-hydroxy-tetrahydrodipicolinate synthase [Actinobacteria bacterium]|nr:MAG: 4-hydroxy-tetrahydrodipicolinate synthase [Actinomycetota bacterium]